MQRFALIFCICCHAALAQAANYTYQLIDYPGASRTVVNGINNSGTIVGSFDSDAGRRGFLYDGSTYTEFNYPGATWTELNGINNLGHLVGRFGSGDDTKAFVYDGTDYETFDVSPAPGFGADINDLGQVAGTRPLEVAPGVFSPDGESFFWEEGQLTLIEIDDGAVVGIGGLNNSASIVGGFRSPGAGAFEIQSFEINNGLVHAFDFEHYYAFLGGINSQGDLVLNTMDGSVLSPTFNSFLILGGVQHAIDFPNETTSATDLNDHGWIVGTYVESNTQRGVLAIPVPEPATVWLAALAIAGIATRSKRILKGAREVVVSRLLAAGDVSLLTLPHGHLPCNASR